VATVELFAGGGFMRISLEASDLLTPKPEPPKRDEIDHFSDASRRRMMDYLAKVDYSQIPFWLELTCHTPSRRKNGDENSARLEAVRILNH
jgi:hypothetical protein